MEAARVLDAIDDGALDRLLVELVRAETVNPPGREEPAAVVVARALEAGGLPVEWQTVAPGRPNLIARLPGAGRRPALLFSGHLDTVPVSDAAWRFPPFEAAIHGGRLYGRGASDMKAGLAAMVAAAVAIRRAGVALAGDLVFAATVDEEVACRGARALVARGLGPLQGVVIGEPSDLDVYVAEKGALWLEATLRGVAAHGAYPHLGRNAINAMARAIAALEGIELPQTLHPLLGGMTLNVGTIQGGTKTNIVADRCTVTLDIRTVPGQSHAEIVRAVERVLAATGLEAEIRVVSDYAPTETPPDAELVQALVAEASAARGEPARVTGAFYFTDGAVFAPAWQVPVAICGPGAPETAHKPDEWVDLERVHQAARVYARTALRLLA